MLRLISIPPPAPAEPPRWVTSSTGSAPATIRTEKDWVIGKSGKWVISNLPAYKIPSYPILFSLFLQLPATALNFSLVSVDFQIDDGLFTAIKRTERFSVATGPFVLGMNLVVHIG